MFSHLNSRRGTTPPSQAGSMLTASNNTTSGGGSRTLASKSMTTTSSGAFRSKHSTISSNNKKKDGDGAGGGSNKPKAPCIAQVFIQFEEMPPIFQQQPSRSTNQSSGGGASRRGSNVSDIGSPNASPNAGGKGAYGQQVLSAEMMAFSLKAPQVVRLMGDDTAATAIEKALRSYYTAAEEMEKNRRTAVEVAKAKKEEKNKKGKGGNNSSSPLRNSANGSPLLSNKKRTTSPDNDKKQKKDGGKAPPTTAPIVDPTWDELLPSRLLDDYQLYIADVDGALPSTSTVDTSASTASAAAPPATSDDQQSSATDDKTMDESKPSNPQPTFLTPEQVRTQLAQRLLATDAVVRNHPKSAFPFTYRLVYAPVKGKPRGQAPPVVAASQALDGSLPLSSPNNLSSSVAMNAVQRFMAVAGVASPTARAVMMDDDTAKSRGFKPLGFLKPFSHAPPASVMSPSNLLGATSGTFTPSASRSFEGGKGGDDIFAAPPAALQQQNTSGEDGAPQEDGVDLTELDVTVEDVMKQSGLTLYDVAVYGDGPLAVHGKEFCHQESIRLTREELQLKRDANVVLLERRRARNETTRLEECGGRVLSLREETMKKRKDDADRLAKTSYEKAKEENERIRQKVERDMQTAKKLEEHQEHVRQQLKEEEARRKALEDNLIEKLKAREQARQERTTLEGEATTFAREARKAGPMVFQLNTHRPQLRQLDQAARQTLLKEKLVSDLDTTIQNEEKLGQTRLLQAVQERKKQNMVASDTQMVCDQELDAVTHKLNRRTQRHEDEKRQQRLAAATTSDPRFVKLLRKEPTIYRDDPSTISDPNASAAAEHERFLKWREEKQAQQRAVCAKKELHMPRKERPVPDPQMPPLLAASQQRPLSTTELLALNNTI